MAFSISCSISLCILFVVSISSTSAEVESARNNYENGHPYFLVRLKRSPQRSYTFSGFNPVNGYAAFATGADFLPYYQYPSAASQPASPAQAGESYVPSSSNNSPSADFAPTMDYQPNPEYPGGNGGEEEPKLSSGLTPPGEYGPNTGYNQDPYASPKLSKKKPGYPAALLIDDENDNDDRKSKSSSHASFNAWFPIYVGTYPNSDAYKDGTKAPNGDRSSTTIISNSVSNGRSSVASSHAIAYGGEPPMHRKG